MSCTCALQTFRRSFQSCAPSYRRRDVLQASSSTKEGTTPFGLTQAMFSRPMVACTRESYSLYEFATRPYFHRYTQDAIDLCDALSSFSSHGKATLHEISRVMGLPGKPKGFDGSEVERYFRGRSLTTARPT
jgi:hypothetical protein